MVPILTYGSESWTMNNAAANVINAGKMWFLRKMQRLSYMDRITDEEVLRRAETGRKLCIKIREGHARFFGDVMGETDWKNIIRTGMTNEKKSRGRQRVKHLDGRKMWLRKENTVLIHSVRERKEYRETIANAIRQGT